MTKNLERDNIQNEHIRGTARELQVSTKITEKRLEWYGHLLGREGNTSRQMSAN